MTTQAIIMSDADSMILASDPGVMTTLAVALECEMATNAAARAAYARIYGCEWVSLSDVQEMEYAARSINHTPSSLASTIAR